MKIKPFNTILLVMKLDHEKKTAGGLIMTESKQGFFVKYLVIAVGDLVEKIKPDTKVIGYDLMEPIEVGGKLGFITQDKIFGEVEDDES